jgi:uncharacterized membrane protein
MNYDETITTTAGLEHSWAALENVTTLPQWTASMTAVEPLDGQALELGHRFRVRQPGLPPTVWRVCDVRPGASFSWDSHVPGVHTVGYHRVESEPDGTTRFRIGIQQTGALAWLVTLFIAARTRRYLRMEAAGLKAAAEAVAAAAADDEAAATGGR